MRRSYLLCKGPGAVSWVGGAKGDPSIRHNPAWGERSLPGCGGRRARSIGAFRNFGLYSKKTLEMHLFIERLLRARPFLSTREIYVIRKHRKRRVSTVGSIFPECEGGEQPLCITPKAVGIVVDWLVFNIRSCLKSYSFKPSLVFVQTTNYYSSERGI